MSLSLFPTKTSTLARPAPLRRVVPPQAPLLDDLLGRLDPLPERALLLGLCEDGFPLLLDLADPASGSLLVASDVQLGNASLLGSILASACRLNRPDQLQTHVISPHRGDFTHLYAQPHFGEFFHPQSARSAHFIQYLWGLVERRRFGYDHGAIQLVVIDALDLLLDGLSPAHREDLLWLVRTGPSQGVWLLAALGTAYYRPAMHPLIEAFPTRILGRTRSPRLTTYLSGDPSLDASRLHPGAQFFVRTGGQLLGFWGARLQG